jgi:hypothetical protein
MRHVNLFSDRALVCSVLLLDRLAYASNSVSSRCLVPSEGDSVLHSPCQWLWEHGIVNYDAWQLERRELLFGNNCVYM